MAEIPVSFRQESRDRYLTYALSVVSGRALPDVRDGLKPVQRRILYAMLNNLHLRPTGTHKKSANVIGEVIGKFHPHGDVACYEAMARMAQDFSLRYPLVDGQGNFGSLDGDSPAAYRYTEVKLREAAIEVLGEIDQETVDFRDNFDGTVQEPLVLPSRLPNLLANGSSGIAVGMATSIPPHNLLELVDGLIEVLKDPEITHANLTKIIKAPDFPTGCQIVSSKKEITDVYKTGRGAIKMRGDWKLEEGSRGKKLIIITSVPFAINKAQLVEKIAGLVIDKKLPQLTDVRDESTDEVRVVLELASGADPDLVLPYLYRNTPLETNFNVNLTALVPTETGSTRPELLSLRDMLSHFVDFRMEVVENRLLFEKRNLEERVHILEGFVKIFKGLDEAIKIVRKSVGRTDAAQKLRKRFKLTERQSFAIVDLRIYQLSKTNIDEIKAELKEKKERLKEIEAILKSKKKIAKLVRTDLESLKKAFNEKRRCRIVKADEEVEFNEADYVVEEDVFAIVTRDGWLKRIRQTNELSSTRLRPNDSILSALPLSTRDSMILFTNLGYMYSLRVSEFPSSSGYGSPVQKLLKFRDGERVVATMCSPDDRESEQEEQLSMFMEGGETLVLVSAKGVGFAYETDDITGIKRNGKRVMKLRKGDELMAVCLLDKKVAMFTRKGSGLEISAKEIPERAQPAVGVALMGVRAGDKIVAAVSYTRSATVEIADTKGKVKSVKSKDITSGRRGLKGTKALGRGEIETVEVT